MWLACLWYHYICPILCHSLNKNFNGPFTFQKIVKRKPAKTFFLAFLSFFFYLFCLFSMLFLSFPFDGQRTKNTWASASIASISWQGIVSGKAQLSKWKEYFEISWFYVIYSKVESLHKLFSSCSPLLCISVVLYIFL